MFLPSYNSLSCNCYLKNFLLYFPQKLTEILDFYTLIVPEPLGLLYCSKAHMKVHTFLYKFAIIRFYLAPLDLPEILVCKIAYGININNRTSVMIDTSKNCYTFNFKIPFRF